MSEEETVIYKEDGVYWSSIISRDHFFEMHQCERTYIENIIDVDKIEKEIWERKIYDRRKD